MRRFLIGFVAIVIFFIASVVPVQAQSWRDSSFGAEYDAADQGEVNQGAYVDRATKGNVNSVSCMIMPILGACTDDPNKLVELYQKSAIGILGKQIASIYMTPPADLALWIQDTGHTLGFLPKPAYAQGIGFSGLSGLLPLWKVFRNISYALLAIVMIVIGFMVMLRKKIDPKTVVTAQNALPRIVLTLILITFSYAIVGFLVDISYFLILLAVALFKSSGMLPNPDAAQALYSQGGLADNVFNIEANPYKILLGYNWNAGIADAAFVTLGGILAALGLIALGPIGAAPGLLLGLGFPLIHLLLGIALLFLFIRLLFFFVGAYVQIIIGLLFGPIQILFEAVPGGGGFSSWFKNMVANLAVFPVASVFFMLSAVMSNFSNSPTTPLWAPPYVGVINNSVSISSLLALGLIFAIPSVAGQIKEALKAKPAVDAGPGGLIGSFGAPANILMQGVHFFQSHETLKAMRQRIPGATAPGGEAKPHA